MSGKSAELPFAVRYTDVSYAGQTGLVQTQHFLAFAAVNLRRFNRHCQSGHWASLMT
ncbi:hypothetical protein SPH72_04525 [Rhodobacterales bacterium FZCC0083]|nr:hypothetical protein SPH72_04525 [Rhodobacterales bacterium FZCC0083]